jgi:hypothetical protein
LLYISKFSGYKDEIVENEIVVDENNEVENSMNGSIDPPIGPGDAEQSQEAGEGEGENGETSADSEKNLLAKEEREDVGEASADLEKDLLAKEEDKKRKPGGVEEDAFYFWKR